MKFLDLNISKDLVDGIEYFNFTNLTEIQEKIIPEILKGNDVLACSHTGSGKTAAFLIPIIEHIISDSDNKGVKSLIVCPTRELCLQIEEQILGLAYLTNVTSCPIYGGGEDSVFEKQKNSLKEGNTSIIVATPGRLISHLALGYADFSNLKHFILDEADEMLNMGFLEDIMKIIDFLPKKRQNMLFSATMPSEIKKLTSKILTNPVIVDINKSKPALEIEQYKILVYKKDKLKLLKELLRKNSDKRIIIFSSTKSNVNNLCKDLLSKNFLCKGINSSYTQSERNQVISDFKNSKINILVATNLLARGVDILDVGIIINYEIPDNPEDYVHRIGRTARAGKDGVAYSLVSEDEVKYFMNIEELLDKSIPNKTMPEILKDVPDYKVIKSAHKKYFKRKNRRKPNNIK